MNVHSPNMHRTNVEQVTFLDTLDPPRWTGQLRLPGKPHPIDILIFNLDGEFWAVPSLCSHLAYNLTSCVLVNGSTLICPAHGERIELKRVGFPVHESQGQFVVLFKDFTPCRTTENRSISASENAKTVQQLQEEVKQLRMASLKQNRKISVITQSMDTMLCESEAQKNKLKEKADKQQTMARFVDSVLDTIEDLLFIIDTKGLILRINATVQQELGFTESELLGTNIDNLLSTGGCEDLSRALPILPWTIHSVLLETIRLSGRYSCEQELIGKGLHTHKSVFWLKSGLLHSAQGKFEGAVLTALNISELKNREAQLRLRNTVFENSSEAIFITDPQGIILEVNTAFCSIMGYSRNEVIGQTTRILKSHLHDQAFYKRLWQSLLNQGTWKGEMWDRRKNGEFCPMLLSINGVYNTAGILTHYVAIATDISHQKNTERELKQLAYYDALTNLPNRALFKNRLEHELKLAERKQNRLALFFLDLDHFKNINDTLGHWAGDLLLQIVSTRIQSCVRKTDIVARLSGDEFTIILPGLASIDTATELAQQLIKAMAIPMQIIDHIVYVGVSIGITIFPNDGTDFDTLTKHADAAMYASKTKGRGMFQYFEPAMDETAKQRVLLENALRVAIEQEEFQLYYQPKADCVTGRITGAEALIRWHRPGFGLIPPDKFIYIAEETGLIVPIGKWILKTACLQANIWRRKNAEFRTAINLSPRQLLADDFIRVLDATLAETGTHPQWIELEITESLIMHDIETAKERLNQIRERGIHVAMDDFGTGYSSLSYLKILPIQTLKIDRSFVMAYTGDPASNEAAFIKTIISLGQMLGMTVVAEGVETETQLALLQSYGCHVFQGYYLSPPLPWDKFQSQYLYLD